MMMKFAVISAIVLVCYVSFAAPTFIYDGCFGDDITTSVLDGTPNVMPNGTSNPIESCLNFCSSSGYVFAGIKSLECFCGNNSLTSQNITDDVNCDIPCESFSNGTCGGHTSISVYHSGGYNVNNGVDASKFPSSVGCYIDYMNRVLGDFTFVSDNMTVETCINRCRSKTHYYAGLEHSRECYCGNVMTFTDQVNNTECSETCSGDPTQHCGGTWRISVYEAIPAPTVTYAGCFPEGIINGSFHDMTGVSYKPIERCIILCLQTNYTVAGIISTSCFCGNNSLTSQNKMDDVNCDITCEGNSNGTCGGNSSLSVYYAKEYLEIHDVDTSKFPISSGCYIDYPNRILNGPRIESDNMTVENCVNYCTHKNYYFAGLEYSRECFCGNIIQLTDTADDKDCSATCTGDPTQKCGGTWHISVYKAKPFVYVGCYDDLEKVHLLEGPLITSAVMTIEKCVRYCNIRNYNYAGLRNSKYCECGNHAISANLQDKVNDADCSENCAGDSSQKCGSMWHFSIYQAKPTFIYNGCFTDNPDRILQGPVIASDDMTVEKCVNLCGQENNTYAGVESARQCFCGDTITSTENVHDSKCSAPCAGDTSQKCGGTWSISMYEILANLRLE